MTPDGQRRLIQALFTEPDPDPWVLIVSGLLGLAAFLIVGYLAIARFG